MECIVLAGGLGTRLRGAIGDFPKCMAPVNGKPFLHYILNYLQEQGCTRLILSLGYKHEIITEWLQTETRPYAIDFVIEYEPLGTGGGILLALHQASAEDVFVLNGDTFFRVQLSDMYDFHVEQQAGTTLALKPMQNFERYGVVNTDDKNCIVTFEEKQYREEGNINGGIYVVNKAFVLQKNLPVKCSFEKDFFEAFVNEKRFSAYISNSYFIDIGIPEDYEKAQLDFKVMQL
jgi:D-glycero-alpha-D-manno-heptose 1-phosphate guanylyltransferase